MPTTNFSLYQIQLLFQVFTLDAKHSHLKTLIMLILTSKAYASLCEDHVWCNANLILKTRFGDNLCGT